MGAPVCNEMHYTMITAFAVICSWASRGQIDRNDVLRNNRVMIGLRIANNDKISRAWEDNIETAYQRARNGREQTISLKDYNTKNQY